MWRVWGDRAIGARAGYCCRESKAHVTRRAESVDAYVAMHVIERVSRDDAKDLLVDDDRPDLGELHAKLVTARAELEEWRQLAEQGEVTPLSFGPDGEAVPGRH